jgi:hypothetical protein
MPKHPTKKHNAQATSAAPPNARMRLVEENGEVVCYVNVEGKPIAKRYSGQGWISLEPGYTVCGSEPGTDYNIVEIHYDPNAAGRQ